MSEKSVSIDEGLDNEILCKIKQLKRSKSAYIGHLTKTIDRISLMIKEAENFQKVKCLQEQLFLLLTKLKDVIDKLVAMIEEPEEIIDLNESYFEQNSRIIDFNKTIEDYLVENSKIDRKTVLAEQFQSGNPDSIQNSPVNSVKSMFTPVRPKIEKEKIMLELLKSQNDEILTNVDEKHQNDGIFYHENPFINKCESPNRLGEEIKNPLPRDSLDLYPKFVYSEAPSALDKNKVESKEPVDKFIDELEEGKEVIIPRNNSGIMNVNMALQRELESRFLPVIPLKTFEGDPATWPEFIQNFKNRVHMKETYDNCTRMDQLLSVLRGEAKRAIESIGSDAIFYATALKILKKNFGNPQVVSYLKMKNVLEKPQIKPNERAALRKYHQEIKSNTIWLEMMGYNDAINSTENLAKAVKRLPQYLRQKLYAYMESKKNQTMNLIEFEKWLESRLHQYFNPVADIIAIQENNMYYKARNSNDRIKTNQVSIVNQINKISCWLCQGEHKIHQCKRFIDSSIDSKKQIVIKQKLCWNCLAKGHRINECKSTTTCRQPNCGQKHHTLLHQTKDNCGDNANFIQAVSQNNQVRCAKERQRTYLQVIPIVISHNDKSFYTNALLDSGSDSTLLEEDLAKKIDLQSDAAKLTIENALLATKSVTSGLVNFQISSNDHPNKISINGAWTVPNLSIRNYSYDSKDLKQRYEHLKSIPLPFHQSKEIGVIIGSDNPDLLIQLEYKAGKKNEPYAVRTKLGWVVMGGKSFRQSNLVRNNFISTLESIDVQQFWSIENYGTVNKKDPILMSREEQNALSILDDTIETIDNRYSIGMLWKEKNTSLPNNKQLAEQRLKSLERKLSKQPKLEDKYRNTIQSYIDKGYARKLTDQEVQTKSSITNYLPHNYVINPKKPDKIRIVFDARAKYQGLSLNDRLHKGPDFLNSLVSILIRFRKGKYAVTSDIEEMFHQVRVRKADQDALRFLWRTDSTKPPDEYIMTVHLFGKNDSPSCANYALRRCGEDQKDKYTESVLECVEKDFYMDDFLKSDTCETELYELSMKLIEMLKNRHFRLNKWITNSDLIFKSLPESEISPKLIENKNLTERILGVLWNVKNDLLSINIDINKTFSNNKRGILSFLCSIFDPLGILNPCILKIKLIIQDLWKRKLGWDDNLPDDIQRKWHEAKRDIDHLAEITLPRNYNINPKQPFELHIFADSSTVAYGCVAYLRQVAEKQVKVAFVIGKTRLAPLNEKSLSIPKLELQAAVIAVRIKQKLLEEIKPSKVYFWTDSKTVLKYIRNENKRFSVYVSHRINEIKCNTEVKEWNYISSKDNVADDCTRPLDGAKFNNTHRYLQGPNFLHKTSLKDMFETEEDNLSETVNINVVKADMKIEDENASLTKWQRFSNWKRLVRTIAYVKIIATFWLKKSKDKTVTFNKVLSSDNINDSKLLILKEIQRESYSKEIKNLNQNEPLQFSNIQPLQPFIKDNLILVGGRLKNANMSTNSKHPIILPRKHHVTMLIAKDLHEQHHHCGRNQLAVLIREKYWIVNIKSICRTVITSCLYCKRLRVQPKPQLMSDLPDARVSAFNPPFTHTGVDYFGPIIIKQGRKTRTNPGTQKRYGVLFTCMTYRAIHIELAGDLSTDSFILALKRFIARRGLPLYMWSDNGQNFVGANNELKSAFKKINQEEIINITSIRNIKWGFITPTSPWMGGAWESLVKLTKRALRTVTKSRPVYEDQLITILTEVESSINSRPLTSVSDDIDDLSTLTPNHFLRGKSMMNQGSNMIDDKEINSKRKWKAVEAITNMYWKRFVKEYLTELNNRSKWNKKQRNFVKGDIVLIKSDNIPRSFWPLARVVETYASKDDVIRSAKLKLSNTTLVRPVNRLCLLEESN